MVVNTIYLASLSMLTLPLYSITVQMGGDFKAHLLPSNVVHDALRFRSIQVECRSAHVDFSYNLEQRRPCHLRLS